MATTIRFSPDEEEILEAYCKQHRRTKNDVVREYVRSLQIKSEQGMDEADVCSGNQEQLTKWSEDSDGCISGEHRGVKVLLKPRGKQFELYFNGEFFCNIEGGGHITFTEDIIDDRLEDHLL